MVSASRQPRHSKLCSSGCPTNAGMLRTQRIVCSQRGHLGRCSDMAEELIALDAVPMLCATGRWRAATQTAPKARQPSMEHRSGDVVRDAC